MKVLLDLEATLCDGIEAQITAVIQYLALQTTRYTAQLQHIVSNKAAHWKQHVNTLVEWSRFQEKARRSKGEFSLSLMQARSFFTGDAGQKRPVRSAISTFPSVEHRSAPTAPNLELEEEGNCDLTQQVAWPFQSF